MRYSILVLTSFGLFGCGPSGPYLTKDCIKSHTETFVTFIQVDKVSIPQTHVQNICDEYGPEYCVPAEQDYKGSDTCENLTNK